MLAASLPGRRPGSSIDSDRSWSGLTQEALYATLDHELSWSEQELPQYERTKHVHSLHPYLGQYIPQLVEAFLHRYFQPGDVIFDPFVGSGTTLVEANAFGCGSVGCDISAFNCLLSEVKASPYSASVERALEVALRDFSEDTADRRVEATDWLRTWFAPKALNDLLAYRAAIERLDHRDARNVGRVILSRAARSARLTTHFGPRFPRRPVGEPDTVTSTRKPAARSTQAEKFLRRYTLDTTERLREFSLVRSDQPVIVLHEDARTIELPTRPGGIITSPPYPGLIDYHEQHRYSYELLGLEDRRGSEIGAAANGNKAGVLTPPTRTTWLPSYRTRHGRRDLAPQLSSS